MFILTAIILFILVSESLGWTFVVIRHALWLQNHPSYSKRIVLPNRIIAMFAAFSGILSILVWAAYSHCVALYIYGAIDVNYKYVIVSIIAVGTQLTHIHLWVLVSKYLCIPYEMRPIVSKWKTVALYKIFGVEIYDWYCMAMTKWAELAHDSVVHKSLLFNFLEVIPDLVWTKDLKGKYTYVNKSMCDNLLLMDSDDVLGMTVQGVAHKLLIEHGKVYALAEECVRSDNVTKTRRKLSEFFHTGIVDGEYVALRVIKAPLFKDGEIVGIIGMARDVTWNYEKQMYILGLFDGGNVEEGISAFREYNTQYKYPFIKAKRRKK